MIENFPYKITQQERLVRLLFFSLSLSRKPIKELFFCNCLQINILKSYTLEIFFLVLCTGTCFVYICVYVTLYHLSVFLLKIFLSLHTFLLLAVTILIYRQWVTEWPKFLPGIAKRIPHPTKTDSVLTLWMNRTISLWEATDDQAVFNFHVLRWNWMITYLFLVISVQFH